MSHCETGNHTNSWVPKSKRGQTIQRDEAGLFSRVATTHFSELTLSKPKPNSMNDVVQTVKRNSSMKKIDSRLRLLSSSAKTAVLSRKGNHPPGPEEQNHQQKQAWPSSVASSPSVTVSGIGYGAESALTSEASLTARLVEYEHLLERR